MRVIIFALLIVAVVVANIDMVSSAPTEEVQTEKVAVEATTDGRLAADRDDRTPICVPGTKYEIWGVPCVCADDGKGLDCPGVTSP